MISPHPVRTAAALLLGLALRSHAAPPVAGADTFSPLVTTNKTVVRSLGNGADGEAIAFNPVDGLIYHASGNGTIILEKVDTAGTTVTAVPVSGPAPGECFGLVWYQPLDTFLFSSINSRIHTLTSSGVLSAALPGTLPDDTRGLAVIGSRVWGASPFQNKLFEVSPLTGSALSTRDVTVPSGTVTGANALTTDPLTQSTYTVVKISGVAGRVLARLNVATGAATPVGNLGDNFAGLTFDANGRLFGVTGDGASVPETLYRFDRAQVVATEDSGPLQFTGLLANDSDPDAGNTIDTVPGGAFTTPSGATVQVMAGGAFSYDPSTSETLNALAQDALFDDAFTYTVQDSTGEQATGTATVTVAGKNDPPALDLDGPGGTADFQAAPIIVGVPSGPSPIVDTDATIIDPDSPATLTSITATLSGALDNEVLSATGTGGADTILFSANVLTITASAGSAPLADFEAVLRSLQYANNSATPSVGKRTISIVVDDGIARSNAAVARIAVTTRPTLTIPGAPVEAFAPTVQGIAVSFDVSASDAEDGAIAPVAIPASGSVFPVGDTTVNVTATDSDGATVSGSFIVRVRLENPVNVLFIAKGEAVPNATSLADVPSDAVIASFGVPAIDNTGNISYVARWTSASEGKGTSLVVNDRSLAAVGGAVPGVTGATFKSFADPVGSIGRVAFLASLAGVPKPSASAVLSDASGTFAVVAQSGGEAPGTGGATWRAFQAVAIENGAVAFQAQLNAGTGNPVVTTKNDLGIWIGDGSIAPTLLFREADAVGTTTIKTLVSFRPGAGSPGQGRGWLVNPAGIPRTLALATLADSTQAILSRTLGASTVVLSQTGAGATGGPTIPNTSFASYGLPATNPDGDRTFLASLTVGEGGVTKADARGVFADFGLPQHQAIVRTGGSGPVVFTGLNDPLLASDGSIAFGGTIAGEKGAAGSTVWWLPAGENSLLLAAQGTKPAPGVTDSQFSKFSSLAIAANRGPLFIGSLLPGKGGVSSKTASGLWATDYARQTRLIFQRGVTQVGGKTVKSFKLLSATVGSTGVTRSFNDRQQIAWLATFSDKTSGIVISQVP